MLEPLDWAETRTVPFFVSRAAFHTSNSRPIHSSPSAGKPTMVSTVTLARPVSLFGTEPSPPVTVHFCTLHGSRCSNILNSGSARPVTTWRLATMVVNGATVVHSSFVTLGEM